MPGSDRLAPAVAARKLVTEELEQARAAILAGSVVTGHMTSASDLDVVVITDDPAAPFRRSLYYGGWPVELFVHTEGSIHAWWQLNEERFRPALAFMCARGEVVLDTDGAAARVQVKASELLDAGPPLLPAEELDLLRYGVTDSLDDLLAGPRDPERHFIVASIVAGLCDLAMENRRSFRGSGKWTFRMAEEADPGFAEDLSAALQAVEAGEVGPLQMLVQGELARAGGPLFDGYWASGGPRLRRPGE
jgi:nucleotidyltransferase-like protein